MLSSINFLFLISLAVTTWIILCYFKQIELQREEQMTVEIHMNNAFEENIKPNACFENYDIYLNFLAVFACIYALAKITSVAEGYVAHQVHARLKHAKHLSSEHLEPTTLEDFRAHQLRFRMQIDFLEKENEKLEQKVKQLEQTNFMLGGNECHETDNKGLPNGMPHTCICNGRDSAVGSIGSFGSVVRKGAVVSNGLTVGNQNINMDIKGSGVDVGGVLRYQNIFIQDQLTRQVYLNDGNINMPFQDFNQEGDNITQTWDKYMEMQNHALQMPTAFNSPTEMANIVPKVVSTEELQTMKGTEQQRGKRQPHRTRSTISTTTLTRQLRCYQTSLHQSHYKHIPHSTLALPIKIFYKNLFVCLLCWFL